VRSIARAHQIAEHDARLLSCTQAEGAHAVKKSEVLELLRDQPDEIDLDKFIYTLWVRQKIERALVEAEDDEGVPHEVFMRQSKQ